MWSGMTPCIGPDLLTGGFFVRIFLPIICGHYAKNEVLLTNLVKFWGGVVRLPRTTGLQLRINLQCIKLSKVMEGTKCLILILNLLLCNLMRVALLTV